MKLREGYVVPSWIIIRGVSDFKKLQIDCTVAENLPDVNKCSSGDVIERFA
jgi:hypothetical protein